MHRRAQYAVLAKKLGVQKLHCVVGFSMGGQQAYHWAAMYPEFVERFVVICSSARTSPHNICFLEGPKAALVASKDFDNGHYKTPADHGVRAFARVYSAWAYGQTWFHEHNYTANGLYPDLESWIREAWEGRFVTNWDANDLITLLHTWQSGDISKIRDGGDLEKALKAITAKALIMPSKTDLYFPPEDSQNEVSHLRDARLAIIPTVWGHAAGGGASLADVAFIADRIKDFLEVTKDFVMPVARSSSSLSATMGSNKPRGLQAARKLRNDRRENRWADKGYKKRALGNIYKTSPTGGSSHAKGIVLEKVGVEAKQPNSAIRKCVRVQLIKNGKKVTAFVPNDGCLNFVDENDEVLISGFGRSGKAKGDIPGVRFKVVKVSGVGLLALWKEKKEKPRS
ncbi:homoserine acetyltransferase [Sanghuangporus baumii]|uniref:Homoserine acetyltransferase n=1 Tax=Sanghuangporus baumii TaxID=108892 RepID=A0A9Q5I2F4_SANBA|nr:homoserine acetyltransferase [Sanghuangporus baumii]